MAFTCAVLGCSNSSRKLTKWKVAMCEIHHVRRDSEICTCNPPFKLLPFPTKKKNPTARDSWRKIINRNVDLKGCKLWEPSKDSRVCSKHFIDGEPSNENPYPTRNSGYDATKRTLFLSPPSNKRNQSSSSPLNVSQSINDE